MCVVTNRAKPYQLALLIKKSLDDVTDTQQSACEATLHNSIKTFISPLSMLYLQKVLLIHLKKCVFYIMYKSKLPLRVSFKKMTLNRF